MFKFSDTARTARSRTQRFQLTPNNDVKVEESLRLHGGEHLQFGFIKISFKGGTHA